ncbi:MAG: PD40 domain-containing protein [Candidatus Latescibacteria bacterium]|nr:PD40 domain-containing protein [Candidatus Latescibacterota bacterium]
MHTYALFEDQTATRVLCDFFATDPNDAPVRLVFPDLEDTRLRHSASNGCLAAYQVLYQLGYLASGEYLCLSFQFADPHRYTNSHGSSAGLAFALKFAQEVYHLKTGRRLQFSVAATGAISDGTRTAQVQRVNAAGAKVQAAVDLLAAGDAVLFPLDNEPELDGSLRTRAQAKGVRLLPVSTLADAVRALIPPLENPGQGRRKLAWGALLVGMLALFAYGVTFIPPRTHLAGAPTIASSLRRVSPGEGMAGSFHYRSGSTYGSVPIGADDPSVPDLTLISGDLYKFSFSTPDSGFLYLFQLDSRGQVEKWPDPDPTAPPVPLPAGARVDIPGELEDWLILDQQTGVDRFLVLGLPQRDPEVERLYEVFRLAVEGRKPEARRRLIERIEGFWRREQTHGDYLRDFSVRHDSSAAALNQEPKTNLIIDLPILIADNSGDHLDLFSVSLATGKQVQITRDAGEHYDPAWSPDGAQVAFASDATGNQEIVVLDADGRSRRNLSQHPANDIQPTWSPDGRFLAFSSNRNNTDPDDYDLYTMQVDGTGLCAIDTTAERTEQPAWSPRGDWIAYIRSTTFDDHRLWLVRPDGTDAHSLDPSIYPINATAPLWSDDGKTIYFSATIPGLKTRIGRLNADGSGHLEMAAEGDDGTPRLVPGAGILVSRSLGNHQYAVAVLDLGYRFPMREQLAPITTVHRFPPTFTCSEALRYIGTAPLGQCATRQVRLVNRGRTRVEITELSFTDPQFNAGKQRFILEVGETRIIDLTFTPTRVGTSYADLSIATDDPTFPPIRLTLNGTGTADSPTSPNRAF